MKMRHLSLFGGLLLSLLIAHPMIQVTGFQLQRTPRPSSTIRARHQQVQSIQQTTSRLAQASALQATTYDKNDQGGVSTSPEVDVDALLKYHGAIALQMTLFSATFFALDKVVDAVGLGPVPFPAVVALFYICSLRSRVFNPLNNERPKRPTIGGSNEDEPPSKGFNDRVMPSFTPPGIVFPIMWILIIGPLRAYSSALVYESTEHFLNPALLAFVFHLSVGDTWNTINNTEKRFGASVVAVLCVTASALNAAVNYYSVDPFAGNLLGLPMIWFAVASSLIAATWQINPVAGEELDQLYPVKGGALTSFAWGASPTEGDA